MTRTVAGIVYRLLHQAIYTVQTRGGERDTYILNYLVMTRAEMMKHYPHLEELRKQLEKVIE